MAEFCPGCPKSGFYVGPVVAEAFTVALVPGDEERGEGVLACFTDTDGINSSYLDVDFASLGADAADFVTKLLDIKDPIAQKLVNRVDRCTGPGSMNEHSHCRAVGSTVMQILAKGTDPLEQ